MQVLTALSSASPAPASVGAPPPPPPESHRLGGELDRCADPIGAGAGAGAGAAADAGAGADADADADAAAAAAVTSAGAGAGAGARGSGEHGVAAQEAPGGAGGAGAAGAAGGAGGLGFGSEYDAASEDTYGNCHTKVTLATAYCPLHTTHYLTSAILTTLYSLRYGHYGDAYPIPTQAAVLATTALVTAALDGVVRGDARCGFACVRPPGDHSILLYYSLRCLTSHELSGSTIHTIR